MIKLPEPVFIRSYGNPYAEGYTEAQLTQVVRDAYEDAAKVCDDVALIADDDVNGISADCSRAIRALIKEIPE